MCIQRDCRQWFDQAARCYVEDHQGCAWCGESYCVSHSLHGERQTYYCQSCDFQASFDNGTGEYAHIVGEDPAAVEAVDSV